MKNTSVNPAAPTLPEELLHAPQWAQDIYRTLPCMASYEDVAAVARMARGTVANLCSDDKGPKKFEFFQTKKLFPRLVVTLWLIERAEKQSRAHRGVKNEKKFL